MKQKHLMIFFCIFVSASLLAACTPRTEQVVTNYTTNAATNQTGMGGQAGQAGAGDGNSLTIVCENTTTGQYVCTEVNASAATAGNTSASNMTGTRADSSCTCTCPDIVSPDGILDDCTCTCPTGTSGAIGSVQYGAVEGSAAVSAGEGRLVLRMICENATGQLVCREAITNTTLELPPECNTTITASGMRVTYC